MMENRSFDHMLGFLNLEQGRTDIDGLTTTMTNTYRGETYLVHPAEGTQLVKAQDSCHLGWCVDEQLANKSGGLVAAPEEELDEVEGADVTPPIRELEEVAA